MDKPMQSISYADLRTQGWQVSFEYRGMQDEVRQYKVHNVLLNHVKKSVEDLKEALFTLGVDTKESHLGVDYRPHRSLTSGKVEDYRFFAPERTDTEWLNSGYASMEVKAITSNMLDMSEHLNEMRRTSQW